MITATKLNMYTVPKNNLNFSKNKKRLARLEYRCNGIHVRYLCHIYIIIYIIHICTEKPHISWTLYSASALTMKRLGEAETQLIFGESVNEN